jgi:hypothetical protein
VVSTSALAVGTAVAVALAVALRLVEGSLVKVISFSESVSCKRMGGVLGAFLHFIPNPDIAPVMVGARRQRKRNQYSVGGRCITVRSLAHLQCVKDV